MKTSLVIPVHHHSGSLEPLFLALQRFLARPGESSEVVLVDDHSPQAGATAQLREFAKRDGVRLIVNPRNLGKGASVKRGMLAASGDYRVFTDSDLTYPLTEVAKIIAALEAGADIAVASRVHDESDHVMTADFIPYAYARYIASRMFNRLVRLTLIPDILDTQAGLKGFTAEATHEVFSRVQIAGFGFDLECLFVARQLDFRVTQVPVVFHHHNEPSSVRIAREAVKMTSDLMRIRWRHWTGEYDARTVPGLEAGPVEESAVA